MLRGLLSNRLTTNAFVRRALAVQVHTVRIRNSDATGFGNYLTAYAKMATEGLHKELHAAGIQTSTVGLHADSVYERDKNNHKSYLLPALTKTNYTKKILLGEKIITVASVVDINKEHGQIIIRYQLKTPLQDEAATGYYVLQKYADGQTAAFSDEEVTALRKSSIGKQSTDTSSYPLPTLISPTSVLGKKVLLGDDECYVQKDQTGHNGVIEANKLFEIAHTYGYEKALMENSGVGLEAKNSKPTMLDSEVFIYCELREGQRYNVYFYTEKNKNDNVFENGHYAWVSTITDEAGQIIAIAKCKHVLLDLDNQSTKTATRAFLAKLNDYALDQGYQGLIENQLVSMAAEESASVLRFRVE